MTSIQRPVRIFKLDSVELADPAPDKSPLEAMKLWAHHYPIIATATLSDGRLVGERLVYEIEKPPVASKG